MSAAPEANPRTVCAVCDGDSFSPVLVGVRDTRFGVEAAYDIVRCDACGLEQTMPRPTADELKDLYAKHYNFGGSKDGLYTRLRAKLLSGPLYRAFLAIDGDISFEAWRPPAPDRNRLLDVGCNEGRKMVAYRGNGFRADGLEFNPVAAAAARDKGFEVHEADLADFDPPHRYDVIVISQVLEHALDPDAMLRDIHRLLAPGGQVWISCPNARSWFRGVFGKMWINWHVPFHITHFRAQDVADALGRTGFAARPVRTQTPAIWVTQSTVAALFARPPKPLRALRNPLLVMGLMGLWRGLLFPWLCLAGLTGHGDCLIAVGEKKG